MKLELELENTKLEILKTIESLFKTRIRLLKSN